MTLLPSGWPFQPSGSAPRLTACSRWFSLVLSCLALNTLALTPARAEDHGGAPPGYAEAINQALAELEAENLPEAKEEFRRAHAIYPNARTLRGMGMVEFELRNYSVSVRMLEAALASQVKPLEGNLLSETQNLLERARRYLGEVVITLEPASAALRVDGLKIQGGDPLRLEVGQHVIEADAPGYASERREIRINGGERSEVVFSLRSLSADSSARVNDAAPAQRGAPSEVQPAYRKWWVWTIVAVVAAGGATAAALLLLRRDESAKTSAIPSATTPPGVSLQTLERY